MGPWGMAIGLPLSMWWYLRQYCRARGKGYYPASAATVVFGGMTAAIITVIVSVVLLGSSTWSDTAIDMVMLLTFPVAALVMTALVALLPRRSHRAGPRRSSFLSSRAPGVGLLVVSFAAVVGCIVSSVAAVGYIVGIWPEPEVAKLSGGLGGMVSILGISVAALTFARGRLGAPGLADTRPTVLYLRVFQQEFDPCAWVLPKERSRYTQRQSIGMTMVTFEQYLGARRHRHTATPSAASCTRFSARAVP